MKELGASHLAIIHRPSIGATHLCTRHGYLRLGSGYVLVVAGEEYWWACAQCLAAEEGYVVRKPTRGVCRP